MAHRVPRRLGGVDQAGIHQLAHLGVVAGDHAHPVVGQPVDPRVTDVEHDPVLAAAGVDDGEPGDGGTHPPLLRVALLRAQDAVVRLAQHVRHVLGAGRRVLDQGRQPLDGDPARHLTGRVAAHPVGDGEDHPPGDHAVLVVVADPPDVGGRPGAHPQGGAVQHPVLGGAHQAPPTTRVSSTDCSTS